MRVLLVEDDAMIGTEMRDALVDAAYAVDWAENAAMALAAAATESYDLILLDLGLPDRDGQDVLVTLRRQHPDVPTIIVTARDMLDERLRGLDNGADDYIVKPFHMAELLARMRTALRRSAGHGSPVLSNGQVWLDPATHQAWGTDGTRIQLSGREFALLQVLLRRPGMIYSRRDLEDHLYGWGEEVQSNAVEFFIHGLRTKLGRDAIKNIRGVGWMVPKDT